MAVGFRTNLFLSNQDLDAISKWEHKAVDNSLTSRLYSSLWGWIVQKIPRNVAPNVLTLASFGCVLQAYWMVTVHGDEFPRAAAIVAAILTYMYYILDAVDGIHAQRTRNASPLGEVFDYSLDNLGTSFQIFTITKVMGWNDPLLQWYLVQAAQLVVLLKHLSAYNAVDRAVRYGMITGPGEAVHLVVAIMCLHGITGRAFLWNGFVKILRLADAYVVKLGLPPLPDDVRVDGVVNANLFLTKGCQIFYYLLTFRVLTILVRMLFKTKEKVVNGKVNHVPADYHRRSGRALLICIFSRMIPAIIMGFTEREDIRAVPHQRIINDGLFFAILIMDVIVAKIANRPIHGLVVIMSMVSVISDFAIYASIALYFVTVIGDIANYLNLPILNTVTNIYCDGVCDLLHLGHMNQFKQAHNVVPGGTRLFVGLMNDADATAYKRQPIMTEDERYASAAACKHVHMVVKDAPVVHMLREKGSKKKTKTEEIIEKYNIHYFAVGAEYEHVPPGKTDYYALPRKLGMCKFTARTQGISTSTLIRRIVNRADEFLSSPKRQTPKKL
eukprot:g8792.t1